MFSFSLAAVTVLTAFGAIAVLWARNAYASGRQSEGASRNSSSDSRLGKITSQPEKKPPLTVRERLLRLMMIFERTVVNRFSFTALSSFMLRRRPGPSQNNTRVSLFTAHLYYFGSRSSGSSVWKTAMAMLYSAMGIFSPGKRLLQRALEPVRSRNVRNKIQ